MLSAMQEPVLARAKDEDMNAIAKDRRRCPDWDQRHEIIAEWRLSRMRAIAWDDDAHPHADLSCPCGARWSWKLRDPAQKGREWRITVPIRTLSPNVRLHWSKRARQTAAERFLTTLKLREGFPSGEMPIPPLSVILTRISPKLMVRADSDNLGLALKGIRDGVQDFVGIDDGCEGVAQAYQWSVAQRKAEGHRRKDYAVGILIEEL